MLTPPTREERRKIIEELRQMLVDLGDEAHEAADHISATCSDEDPYSGDIHLMQAKYLACVTLAYATIRTMQTEIEKLRADQIDDMDSILIDDDEDRLCMAQMLGRTH